MTGDRRSTFHVRFALAALFALALLPGGSGRARAEDGRDAAVHDARLDSLVGSWTVRREIRGEVAGNTLDAQWVLDHRFLSLHYRDVARPMQYEAQVYVGWDEERRAYVAHWLDVFGGRFSETLGYGAWEADSLLFVFEYPEGRFENCFRWHPALHEWTSRLVSVDSAGVRHPFAFDRMRRVPVKARGQGTR
jgi:hypothetical protein